MHREICLVISLIANIQCARILAFFPVPSISHQVVFRPLTQELARRGHELVILTPDPAFEKGKAPPNITEIDLHDISYKLWRESFVEAVKGKSTDHLEILRIGFTKVSEIFEVQLNIEEVKELIKKREKFDLILVEACVQPAIVLSYLFNAPMIQVSSFVAVLQNYETVGAPAHYLMYPEMFRQRLYNLSLGEKINAVYEEIKYRRIQRQFSEIDNMILRRNFGEKVPPVQELRNNVAMLFVNVHPIWEDNRPVPPTVIHMGGLHQKETKELPKDLKSYLDSSAHGVIYMSFGTNVDPSQLPTEKIQIFCKVFSKLPYDVLWKWNADKLPGKPKNVRISKWLPQSDLLRHPKVKLFITQAGLQSTDEAITAGVPLIAFPLLGDQWYNAEKYEKHGIGLNFNIAHITEEILEKAVKEVINDSKYKESITRLGALMRDQPQSPLQRAVWWTEHVLRHRGAAHLRSAAANVSWTDYLMLDVVLVLLSGAILAFVLLSTIVLITIKSLSVKSKIKHD